MPRFDTPEMLELARQAQGDPKLVDQLLRAATLEAAQRIFAHYAVRNLLESLARPVAPPKPFEWRHKRFREWGKKK